MLPLVGLTGVKGSGKDTAGAYLVEKYGYKRTAFADELKLELAVTLDNNHTVEETNQIIAYMEAHKRDDISLPTGWPRQLLQAYGMARRDLNGPNYWIEQTTLAPGICVTDVRFANEVAAIKAKGGTLIRINRETQKKRHWWNRKGPWDRHPSETAIDGLKIEWDVDNNGTLTDLYKQLDDIVKIYE